MKDNSKVIVRSIDVKHEKQQRFLPHSLLHLFLRRLDFHSRTRLKMDKDINLSFCLFSLPVARRNTLAKSLCHLMIWFIDKQTGKQTSFTFDQPGNKVCNKVCLFLHLSNWSTYFFCFAVNHPLSGLCVSGYFVYPPVQVYIQQILLVPSSPSRNLSQG